MIFNAATQQMKHFNSSLNTFRALTLWLRRNRPGTTFGALETVSVLT